MTVQVDRREELRMLRAYSPAEIARVLTEAAKAGADEGSRTMRGQAPIGRGPLDSRYRRAGLGHGTFRSTVRAAEIRRPGPSGERGQVVGPMGRHSGIRGFVEKRTGWGARSASRVAGVMRAASDAVLARYVKARP